MADLLKDLTKDLSKVANKSWKMGKDYAMGTPEIEIKVREATTNEPWGPTTAEMQELAQASFSYADLPIVMNMLWRRMTDTGKDWRHVYKSLIVLDFLIKHGSEQAIREMRYHIVDLQTLTSFQYMDENYQDVGQSVRERAKKVLELLHDEKRMKEERTKAQQNRNKYQGYGSDSSMRGGPRSGGYGNDYGDRPSYRSSGGGGGGGGGDSYGGGRSGYGYGDEGDSYGSRESPYGGRRETSPYGGRREGGGGGGGGASSGGSGGYRSRTADLSDSDSDSDTEFQMPARTTPKPATSTGGGGSSVPRKPSVDHGNGGDTFDPFGQLAATHAVPSAATSSSSPFFPHESLIPTGPALTTGNGSSSSSSSSSSVLPPNLFDTPSTPSGGGMPPLGAMGGGASLFPIGGASPLAASGGGGGSAPPRGAQQGVVDSEWDAFVGFDDPRRAKEENQNDLWSKHKNLFDLQHLSLSEKEAAAAAVGGAQQKRPMATMTSAAGRGRGGPTSPTPLSPSSAGSGATALRSPPLGGAGAMPSSMGMTPVYPGMAATPYGMPYGGAAMMHPGMAVGYAPGVPGMVPMGYAGATAPAPYASAPVPGAATLGSASIAQRPGASSSASNGSSLLF